ncbi:Pex12 amino terminal region-domain-containing protein [Morchella snyderi]|nr:Pex12 amino terminal region-domain-containing protein [Morchella snyderi]
MPTTTAAAAAATASATGTTTAIATLSQPADWQLAHQRAQERITTLQASRQQEVASHGRLGTLFTTRGGDVKTGARPAFRVGQLDTELLDEELLELLKGQLWNGLKYFRPSLKENWEPEFMLLLRAALFKLTIWDHNATYGAALQNLVYTDARRSGPIDHPPTVLQKSAYGLLTVGGRYFYQRLHLYLLSHSNPEDSTPSTERMSRMMDTLSTAHSTVSFVSFAAFLLTGHYRTILDRVLRMRLVSPSHIVSREVSFEYLNRQLVWHAFTEFLLFILPLIRVSRWRRWWSRALRKLRGSNADPSAPQGELAFLPERTCAICHKETDTSGDFGATGGKATDVVNPYEAIGCGHIYCYVCIAGKIELEEGDGWSCLRCGTIIKRCRPWRGGLKGLTGVGDWGEEVDRRKVGFDDEEEGELESDGELYDETDGTERAEDEEDDLSEAGTEKPDMNRLGASLKRRSGSSLWAEDSFDESVYNTAEGEDEGSEDDKRGRS